MSKNMEGREEGEEGSNVTMYPFCWTMYSKLLVGSVSNPTVRYVRIETEN